MAREYFNEINDYLNVGDYNQKRAIDGLNTVANIISNVESEKEKLQEQIKLIPVHNFKKDELGENIEQYIDDINKMIDNNIIKRLNAIVYMKGSIKSKAHLKDRNEALNAYNMGIDN